MERTGEETARIGRVPKYYQHDRRYHGGVLAEEAGEKAEEEVSEREDEEGWPTQRNYFADDDAEDTLSEFLHRMFCPKKEPPIPPNAAGDAPTAV